tara:strand:+ start:1309 stop:2721 length:1413 start_codon:yes stop_codon:yes gene_type:complete
MTSTIKVNTITTESGSTLTVGGCGKTVALASGASQTGFGRTGTVDWQTGSIKTTTFTATSGEGYFVNTTSGPVTVNLPAGVAGAIVGLKDYAGTWNNNAVVLNANGSDKIGGGNAVDPSLEEQGGSVLLVFVDSTQGWLATQQSVTRSPTGAETFIVATGGTITTSGDFKIHTFTGPGTFCVSSIATCAAANTVGYMVVAGGGSGGSCCAGGGGGAGGYREGRNVPIDNFTASPLVANAPTNAITVTETAFPITVGAGGATVGPGSSKTTGLRGSDSIFSTITSTGGGGGYASPPIAAAPGGSGGGASHGNCAAGVGAGNTPPVSPSQGNDGGLFTSPSPGTVDDGGGGGGGAGGAANPSGPVVGQGGAGVSSEITASAVTRASGGSAGMRNAPTAQSGVPVPGASGGGGAGGGSGSYPRPSAASSGGAATANTGGGGGGGARYTPGGGSTYGQGGAGGSGVVVIRYKFQ